MNIKKLSAAVMAAAVLAAAAPMTGVLPDPLSVVASAAEVNYRCDWVDVRADSQYDLMMEKVKVDGKEQYLVKLYGIPEAMLRAPLKTQSNSRFFV